MSTDNPRRSGDVVVEGYRIHFTSIGDGPRLVWIDPALGSSAMRPLQEAIDALADDFEVVTYDRRGRGRNADARSSVDHEVEDLVALIDHVDGATAVIGFSSGAALALRAAAHVYVEALILLEPAVDERPDETGLRPRLAALLDGGENEKAVHAFYEMTGVPPEIVGQIISSGSWSEIIRSALTLLAEIDVAVVDDDVIARLTTPVHLIVSDGSSEEITGMSSRLADRLQASVWTEHGGWHGVEPDALRTRVREILRP